MAETPRHLTPQDLEAWVGAMRDRFHLSADTIPTAAVLDLARDAAAAVARPAAPLSTFVAGFVAARDGGSATDIEDAIAAVSRLADDWDGQE